MSNSFHNPRIPGVYAGVDVKRSVPFYLLDCVERARELADLPYDWDGMGGHCFSKLHIDRAIDFLLELSSNTFDCSNRRLHPPRIVAGPNESIDIHWQTDSYELLINVPDWSSICTFYGDNKSGEEIQGKFMLESNSAWLAAWMTK